MERHARRTRCVRMRRCARGRSLADTLRKLHRQACLRVRSRHAWMPLTLGRIHAHAQAPNLKMIFWPPYDARNGVLPKRAFLQAAHDIPAHIELTMDYGPYYVRSWQPRPHSQPHPQPQPKSHSQARVASTSLSISAETPIADATNAPAQELGPDATSPVTEEVNELMGEIWESLASEQPPGAHGRKLGLKCSQVNEQFGGEWGCSLPAGHEGPHALPPAGYTRRSHAQRPSQPAAAASDAQRAEAPAPAVARLTNSQATTSIEDARKTTTAEAPLRCAATAAPAAALVAPSWFATGHRVEARFRGGARWYPGVIASVAAEGGSCSVAYDDGDIEEAVPHFLVRSSTRPHLSLAAQYDAVVEFAQTEGRASKRQRSNSNSVQQSALAPVPPTHPPAHPPPSPKPPVQQHERDCAPPTEAVTALRTVWSEPGASTPGNREIVVQDPRPDEQGDQGWHSTAAAAVHADCSGSGGGSGAFGRSNRSGPPSEMPQSDGDDDEDLQLALALSESAHMEEQRRRALPIETVPSTPLPAASTPLPVPSMPLPVTGSSPTCLAAAAAPLAAAPPAAAPPAAVSTPAQQHPPICSADEGKPVCSAGAAGASGVWASTVPASKRRQVVEPCDPSDEEDETPLSRRRTTGKAALPNIVGTRELLHAASTPSAASGLSTQPSGANRRPYRIGRRGTTDASELFKPSESSNSRGASSSQLPPSSQPLPPPQQPLHHAAPRKSAADVAAANRSEDTPQLLAVEPDPTLPSQPPSLGPTARSSSLSFGSEVATEPASLRESPVAEPLLLERLQTIQKQVLEKWERVLRSALKLKPADPDYPRHMQEMQRLKEHAEKCEAGLGRHVPALRESMAKRAQLLSSATTGREMIKQMQPPQPSKPMPPTRSQPAASTDARVREKRSQVDRSRAKLEEMSEELGRRRSENAATLRTADPRLHDLAGRSQNILRGAGAYLQERMAAYHLSATVLRARIASLSRSAVVQRLISPPAAGVELINGFVRGHLAVIRPIHELCRDIQTAVRSLGDECIVPGSAPVKWMIPQDGGGAKAIFSDPRGFKLLDNDHWLDTASRFHSTYARLPEHASVHDVLRAVGLLIREQRAELGISEHVLALELASCAAACKCTCELSAKELLRIERADFLQDEHFPHAWPELHRWYPCIQRALQKTPYEEITNTEGHRLYQIKPVKNEPAGYHCTLSEVDPRTLRIFEHSTTPKEGSSSSSKEAVASLLVDPASPKETLAQSVLTYAASKATGALRRVAQQADVVEQARAELAKLEQELARLLAGAAVTDPSAEPQAQPLPTANAQSEKLGPSLSKPAVAKQAAAPVEILPGGAPPTKSPPSKTPASAPSLRAPASQPVQPAPAPSVTSPSSAHDGDAIARAAEAFVRASLLEHDGSMSLTCLGQELTQAMPKWKAVLKVTGLKAWLLGPSNHGQYKIYGPEGTGKQKVTWASARGGPSGACAFTVEAPPGSLAASTCSGRAVPGPTGPQMRPTPATAPPRPASLGVGSPSLRANWGGPARPPPPWGAPRLVAAHRHHPLGHALPQQAPGAPPQSYQRHSTWEWDIGFHGRGVGRGGHWPPPRYG